LRLSNAEYERLAGAADALEGLHGLHAPPSLGDLSALLFARKRTAAQDALTLAHIDAAAAPHDSAFASAFRFLSDTPEPTLPFTGADIVARGIAQGQGVGALLKDLQALWIRAGLPKEPEQLARLLDEALARAKD
jgi:poly(A) polymerase